MNTSISEALFTKTQQAVLGLLFSNPDESYHLRSIILKSGIGQGTIQRELERLTTANMIQRVKRGNQVYYSANRNCPIFNELHNLVLKTIGLADLFRQTLGKLSDKVQVAFIYGSFARGEEKQDSDVDLMVIGKVKMLEVVKALSSVREQTGREINPTVFSPDEYKQKLKEGNHFLSSLLEEPKIFLIEDEDEFRKLG
jgi:predicted nucleotidyltransferase